MASSLQDPTLTINDSTAVLDELGSVAKWKVLGRHLGIHEDRLDEIEEETNKCSRCLELVINDWLRCKHNIKKCGPPSWTSLAKAVQSFDPAKAILIITNHGSSSTEAQPGEEQDNGQSSPKPKRAKLEVPQGSGNDSAPLSSGPSSLPFSCVAPEIESADAGPGSSSTEAQPGEERANPGEKKQLFISYKSKDGVEKFATRMRKDLEGQGFTVWQDTSSLDAGVDFLDEIGLAIHNCNGLIAIFSDNYFDSPYCTRELKMALTQKGKQSTCILPILFGEVDLTKSKKALGASYATAGIQWLRIQPEMGNYDEVLRKLIQGIKKQGIQPHGMEQVDFDTDKSAEPDGGSGGSTKGKKNCKRDTEPTDSELLLHVAHEVIKSEELGRVLELTGVQIAMIKREEHSIVEINMRILDTWKEQVTREPVTWETLIKALREMKMKKLADRIESNLE